jgi:hypothetical protein
VPSYNSRFEQSIAYGAYDLLQVAAPGAEVLAEYVGSFYTGVPALVRNSHWVMGETGRVARGENLGRIALPKPHLSSKNQHEPRGYETCLIDRISRA